MSLAYRSFPIEEQQGDIVTQRTAPWRLPPNDPGIGGGTAGSIKVMIGGDGVEPPFGSATPTNVWPGFSNADKPTDNPGYVAPSLTGTERWFPIANHGWGRCIQVRPPYGLLFNTYGLTPTDGRVRYGLCAYGPYDELSSRPVNAFPFPNWKMLMLPSDATLAIGYSPTGKLIVLNGVAADGRTVNEINWSGTWGTLATLGSQIAQMPATAAANGWRYQDEQHGGTQRLTLDWRNEVWIVRTKDGSTAPSNFIFGFTTNNPPNGAWFEVQVPQAVLDRAGDIGNLMLAVDRYYQRIFALQQDRINPDDNFTIKAPAIVWEITPGSIAGGVLQCTWKPVSMTGAPNIRALSTAQVRQSFHHIGGIRFVHMEARFGDSTPYALPRLPTDNPVDGNIDGNGTKWNWGGSSYFEAQIPVESPRSVTFQRYDWPRPTDANGFIRPANSKHERWAQRGPDGKLFLGGGDTDHLVGGDREPIFSSYSKDLASVDPENPATLAIETYMNWRVDEVNWDYDSRRDGFWWGKGTISQEPPGNADIQFYNPTTKVFGPSWNRGQMTVVGPESIWPSNENSSWLGYDPALDRLVKFGGGGGQNYLIIIENLSGTPTRQVWRINALQNDGPSSPPGGSVWWKLDLNNMIDVQRDTQCMNKATGDVYVCHWKSRALLRIDTRAGFIDMGTHRRAKVYYEGVLLPASPPTENMLYMGHCETFLVVQTRESMGRARLYTWAPGEPRFTEHPTPSDYCGSTMITFKKGGVWKVFSNGSVPPREGLGDRYYVATIK